MKKVIATKNAPAAIGPYSQAMQVGNMLFASGQLGIDPATGLFVEGSGKEQTVPHPARGFCLIHIAQYMPLCYFLWLHTARSITPIALLQKMF